MNSNNELFGDDRGQTKGPLILPAVAVVVLVGGLILASVLEASPAAMEAASEDIVTTPKCTTIWNCGASGLIPPLLVVVVLALVICAWRGWRSEE